MNKVIALVDLGVGGGRGCSPRRANQSEYSRRVTPRSKLHRSVKQGLLGIGDKDVMCALDTADIDRIGAILELETLNATDSEGREGQNECLEGGEHEVEEDEVLHAARPAFRGLVCWATIAQHFESVLAGRHGEIGAVRLDGQE